MNDKPTYGVKRVGDSIKFWIGVRYFTLDVRHDDGEDNVGPFVAGSLEVALKELAGDE